MCQSYRNIILSVIFILLTRCDIYSQESSVCQFAAGTRMDFIGLNNYENRNYGLFHGEVDVSLSVLTDNLKLFKGGEFFVQGMSIFGDKASTNYAGDLQIFSNLESDTRIFLYQCWYKQTLNKLIIKFGQLDMNADYSVSGYGSSLINSSFGVIPTISLNMPVSIFAYLTAGISFKYMATNRITVQTAFFNGDPGNYSSNRHNLNWDFSSENGWFNISEVHYKTKSNLMQGKYKGGIFYHSKTTGLAPDLSSSNGNFGFFAMGDQQLISEKNTIKNGLSIFFQISYSPSKVNLIGSYYAMGLIYRGIFPRMNEDECTVAVASAHLGRDVLLNNPEYFPHETAVELTYKKYLTPNIIVQPDFQYIVNPGANRLFKGNSTIGLIRVIANL